MIRSFNLPVNADQFVRVVYQKPETWEETAPARPAAPVRRLSPVVRRKDWRETGADLSEHPRRKPLILMMHGFPGGHKGGCDDLFGELEYRFEGMGFPSLRFDFRGCGESDGVEEDFSLETAREDLNAVMQWAQHDAGHRSFVLLGESVGGTLAVLGFVPKLVSGLILLWPALKLKETAFRSLFLRENLLASDAQDQPYVLFEGHRLGTPFVNEIYQSDLTAALEAITVPTLLQHGTADTDVPLEQAYFARDTLPKLVDLGIFEGGGHGLRAPNMREHLFVNIRHFLERVFRPDPAA